MMKKVMVVDDSRIMRNIVKRTFEQMNIPCEFIEAGDGNEALKLLKEVKVNLILLDWNLPGLLGIDFLKQIKSLDEYREIPVVMITSEASRVNLVEAVKAGVKAYITKPIDEEVFREKLSKIEF
jgi:two-component system chemotaxis response regulator CheY